MSLHNCILEQAVSSVFFSRDTKATRLHAGQPVMTTKTKLLAFCIAENKREHFCARKTRPDPKKTRISVVEFCLTRARCHGT